MSGGKKDVKGQIPAKTSSREQDGFVRDYVIKKEREEAAKKH